MPATSVSQPSVSQFEQAGFDEGETEALAYNGLVQSWPEITRLARETTEAPQATHLDLL